MNTVKSLKGIDIYLQGKEDLILNLENAAKEQPIDAFVDITNVMIKSLKNDVEFLKSLKSELISQK
jgi:hypothetical protein